MVRSKSATTLKLSWTILVCFVSTVLTAEHQRAKAGDDVTLFCNGNKPLNWLNKDNKVIGRQKGRIQQNVLGNLIFDPARFSDSGTYTCSSADGRVLHKQIQLEISGAPTLVNITELVNVERDKEAILNCLAEGHPEPVITWYMYKHGRRQNISEGNTLNAKMPREYGQVHFLCKAENKFGEDSANITVNVVGKPQVKIIEKSITGAIGQNATVNCAIKSNPLVPHMKWLKNGKLVSTASPRKSIDFRQLSEYEMLITLSIEKLREKDFDEYVCLAVNQYGNGTQKIQITLNSTKSHRTPTKKPRVSPLSASTEHVISSDEIQKQESKNQDIKSSKEEAATQSSESVSSNMGSVCRNSWKQFTAMTLIPFFICTSFFLS